MAPTLPTDNVLGSLYSASQLELGMAIADVMVATRDAGDVLTRPTGNVGTFYSESQLAIAMAIVDSMLANSLTIGGGGGGGGAIGDLDPIAANRLIGNPTGSSAAPSAIPLANSLSFVGGTLSVATGGVQYGMLSNTTVAEVILGNPTTSPGAITQIQLGDGLGFILGELAVPDGSLWIEKIEDLPADIVLGRLDSLGEPETLPLSRDGTYSGDAADTVASMAAVSALASAKVEPDGLVVSRNSGNAKYLDITAGSWVIRDGDSLYRVELASGWTKRLDTVFSEGNNGGLLPAATSIAADTGYFIFCGRKDSTGAIDFAAATDLAGTGLASGFLWRPLCWQLTDSSADIIPLTQYGDYFEWVETPIAFNSWPSTASAGADYDIIYCPAEGLVEVDLAGSAGHHNNDATRRHVVYLSSPSGNLTGYTSSVPGSATNPFLVSTVVAGAAPDVGFSTRRIRTTNGRMKLALRENNPSRSAAPTVAVPGFIFHERRLAG